MALKQFLDIRWGIAIAVALVLAGLSSAQAYYTVFNNDNITDWEYNYYETSDWLEEGSLGWSTGDAPFGNENYFYVSSPTGGYHNIYARKEINLTDSTMGIIKVKAENNFKCYANGNQVFEMSGKMQPIGKYSATGNYFDTPEGYNVYYRGTPYTYLTEQAGYWPAEYTYIDVSRYLKKGNNVIACEAWTDDSAYLYLYYYDKMHAHYDGRAYLDMSFFNLGPEWLEWSKGDSDFNRANASVYSKEIEYTVGTKVISEYHAWDGAWVWGRLPMTDGSYFKWTDSTSICPGCVHLEPIWPYNDTSLYLRKWIWSDENKTMSLQVSDTKLPDCYVNENKVNFTNYNSPYWRYEASIGLAAGQNLIACKSPKAAANSFDMRITGPNGKLAITSVDVDRAPEVNQTLKFTITFANASHPETDVGLVFDIQKNDSTVQDCEYVTEPVGSCNNLTNCVCPPSLCELPGMFCALDKGESRLRCNWTHEVCTGMPYSVSFVTEIISNTSDSKAEINYTPPFAGVYEITITAMDMYDGDTDVFFSNMGVGSSELVPSQNYGFFPTAGNSDESGKGAGTMLLIGLGAAAAGAVALAGAYLVSGSGSGFSLKKMDSSLSQASNAMDTLNAMSGAKATENSNSFWNLISQRYAEYQKALAEIEEERRKVQEENERRNSKNHVSEPESYKLLYDFLKSIKNKTIAEQIRQIEIFFINHKGELTPKHGRILMDYYLVLKHTPPNNPNPPVPQPPPQPIPTSEPEEQPQSSWWSDVVSKADYIYGLLTGQIPLSNLEQGVYNTIMAFIKYLGEGFFSLWSLDTLKSIIIGLIIGAIAIAGVAVLIVEILSSLGIILAPQTVAWISGTIVFVVGWLAPTLNNVGKSCWNDSNTQQCKDAAIQADAELIVILGTIGVAKGVSKLIGRGKYIVSRSSDGTKYDVIDTKTNKLLPEDEATKVLESEAAETGLPKYRTQLIVSDTRFTEYTVDYSLDSPFAVSKSGELLINPSEVAKLSDTALKLGLEHEASELIKFKLQDSGKILSEAEIQNRVARLQISSSAKQEVFEIIEERLIADKIALKNRPDLLQGWKEETSKLRSQIDNIYNFPQPEAEIRSILPDLAYLKALNPSDDVLMGRVNEIIQNLSEANRAEFDQILKVMMEAVKNV
ncbi:MAG: hypothetical protein PHC66_01470 [Candidatus Nanoarchaeia archaeon]|nr:hypothetical protein [Candidatus Nanoarchaeia archaeon]MDD5239172.1 hypothetical protein [Candidatus Nanoarchaeia archaeon]